MFNKINCEYITDKNLMQEHLVDWRNRYFGVALAIFFPETVSDIQSIVALASSENLVIVPQGGNTSLCGGSIPMNNNDIVVNFSKMNKIIEIDKQNHSIEVESGSTLIQVQNAAEKIGLMFPLNIASSNQCQIGGNIATNAGGINVIKYGMMRNLVLGIEVVLSNGDLLTCNKKLYKNNQYLDLKQLFIGSEGTLGLITKATLKLFCPENTTSFLIGVKSIDKALSIIEKINNSLSAAEIIKYDTQKIYNTFSDIKLPFTDEWLLLCETNILNIEPFLQSLSSKYIIDTSNKKLWTIRSNIPFFEKQAGYAAKHDISLPISEIENFLVLNMSKLLNIYPSGMFSVFGHLGDGNLHYNFFVDELNNENIDIFELNISQAIYEDVYKLGGSISAEHGIGQLKKTYFKQFTDNVSYQLNKNIKSALDEKNIMNMGKVLIS